MIFFFYEIFKNFNELFQIEKNSKVIPDRKSDTESLRKLTNAQKRITEVIPFYFYIITVANSAYISITITK